MVMPLLYGLGAKDFLEPLGYVITSCQKCGSTAPFGVFHSKRKVTLFGAPTVSFREQLVIECAACQQRFAVPQDMREEYVANLLSEQDVISRMRQMKAGAAVAVPGQRGPNYYQVLQVDVAADPEVIDAAFRRLAMKYHPDTSIDPNASERMRQLIEAKAILGDPAKRRAYNRSIGITERVHGMRPDDV